MVAEPVAVVAPLINCATGTASDPVIVPPDNVIVNGTLAVVPASAETTETEAANVPLPMFVRVAVPVAVRLPPVMVAVAFTVSTVLVVAAWAAAQNNNAVAKFANGRIISLNSLMKRRKRGIRSSGQVRPRSVTLLEIPASRTNPGVMLQAEPRPSGSAGISPQP